MSKEGQGRKAALVRFKVITALLGLLSVILLLFAGLGIEYYHDTHGPPYFLGGFIVGVPALLATLVSMSVLAKAIGKDANDNEMKQLAPNISCQYTSAMILLPACFIGSILTGVGGFSGDVEDRPKGTNAFLAAVILVGCILTFCVVIASMCTVCTYGRYFGVNINKRGARPVTVADSTSYPDRGTGGVSVNTNVNVITTNVNNQHLSQLEQQNRLLQQQLQLQQQMLNQQQQQNQRGTYPPPPPSYGDPAYPPSDPAYPPSAPPPPYSKVL